MLDLEPLRAAQAYVRWLQSLHLHIELPKTSSPPESFEVRETEVELPRTRKSPVVTISPREAITPSPDMPIGPDREPVLDHPAVPTEVFPAPGGNLGQAEQLERLTHVVNACRKCRLGYERKQAVFGSGNFNADLMFIGEAPGATEDEQGVPFVGRAGNLLTGELEKNGIRREEVFICNIIKCRPPGNRDPLPDEIAACEPYLHEQIQLIKPKMLCGLGRYACSVLMGEAIKIMKIRGTWSQYQGLPLFVCLHPSALLHQPNNRHLFDGDIAALAHRYHEARGQLR